MFGGNKRTKRCQYIGKIDHKRNEKIFLIGKCIITDEYYRITQGFTLFLGISIPWRSKYNWTVHPLSIYTGANYYRRMGEYNKCAQMASDQGSKFTS